MKINKFHFYFGLATFTGFVITGILMRMNIFETRETDILKRMMFRSNHIYILFASLLHLVISFVNPEIQTTRLLWIKNFGSTLCILTTITLYIAFFIDPISESIQRDITRFSIVGLFSGLILLLLTYKLSKE